MKVKTSFANGVNPFAGQPAKPTTRPKAKPKKPPSKPIDFSLLTMANDPIPAHKEFGKRPGKYAPMLDRMISGECIRCRKSDVVNLVRNMTGLVRRSYPDYMLSSMIDYGDGMGRVWLLRKEPEPQKESAQHDTQLKLL